LTATTHRSRFGNGPVLPRRGEVAGSVVGGIEQPDDFKKASPGLYNRLEGRGRFMGRVLLGVGTAPTASSVPE